MADVTPILIKDLAAQTTLSDTDYFIVGGADAKKITVAQMKEALGINELNTKLQYTTQTQTSPNGWYNLVLRKSGRVVTIDGTMTLSTSYNAGNVFFSIENTAYQNGGGTPLVFYNRTANTFHMGYITGNHGIQSVSPFTSGDYVICGTWITG